MSALTRQRARRAAERLSLSGGQAEEVGRHLRGEMRQLGAARSLLAECRRQLAAALREPRPDSTVLLELVFQERVLAERERALSRRLEDSLASLLRPEQAVRLRSLPPGALSDMLGRLCA